MGDDQHVTKEFCKLQHEQTNDTLIEIKEMVRSTHDRLFVGNGQPPLTVQVDRHDRLLTGLMWLGGVVVTGLIGVILERVLR